MGGVTISQLAGGAIPGSLDYAGQTITFTARPDRITEKTLGALTHAMSMSKNAGEAGDLAVMASESIGAFSAMNTELCALVTSWNVEQDDGTPFPLDPERVAELPLLFRVALFSAAISAGSLGEANGTASKPRSRAGSSRVKSISSRK